MKLDLNKVIFLDNHAHSLLRGHLELDVFGFRRCFTESRSQNMIDRHVPANVSYMDMVNKMSRILATTDEESLISIRSRQQEAGYVRTLWDDVSIGGLIVDDGLRSEDMVSTAQLSAIAQRPVYCCRRIETVAEQAIGQCDSFDEFMEKFSSVLFERVSQPLVAIKTILAYRGGLGLRGASTSDAVADFERTKKQVRETGRIMAGPLYHYLLIQAFELAACNEIPVQVHCGIGDDDANLMDSNPLILQPLLKTKTLEHTKFVLLHTYPFVKEASYLASLYPNVYVDVSLSVNLASPAAERIIEDALAQCPTTKLLAGTDGHSCPETHWYAALVWKRALSAVLTKFLEADMLTETQAQDAAANILHANTRRLYKLEGLA